MKAWQIVAAIFLVLLLVGALYGTSSKVWNQGTDKTRDETKTNTKILECVQTNKDKSWKECREEVCGNNGC